MQHNTNYILLYTMGMTTIVAIILAGMSSSLRDVHTENERNYNKKQLLSCLNSYGKFAEENIKLDALPDAEVAEIFKNVKTTVIDHEGKEKQGIDAVDVDMEREEKKPLADRNYPVYIYSGEGGEKIYILSVRGNGLWDKIWGWVAVKNDENRSVVGASFGHKGETPGLGAEIKDNSSWKNQFAKGKQLYKDGKYTSVLVKKGGAKDLLVQVDGISGATVTCDGVSEMLERGLATYMPYLDAQK
jgi:Na+-transporting NADH:ubiquinone oxidoreductase subunit C